MSRSRLFPLLLICLALPLTFAACDDDGGGGSNEDQIADVIETAATSTDPEDCSRLQTDASLEQSELTLEEGQTAVESCEADASEDADNPDSVEVSDVAVDGESATATAAFSGGPQDGSTLTVALVQDGDQWKIDQITDIPVFNAEGFRTSLEEELTNSEDVPPEIATCLTDAFDATSDEDLKALLLSGDEEQFIAIISPCLPTA